MKRPLYNIVRLMLAATMLLLTMAPAMAQTNTVYAGQTSALSVTEAPGETYTWELYTDINGLNLIAVPGNCPASQAYFAGGINTGPSVDVTWLSPGTYYYKVTASSSCPSENVRFGVMVVLNALPVAVIEDPSPICRGDEATLVINLSGTAPWNISLSDGTTTVTYDNIVASPFILTLTPTSTTTYTVTSVTDANGTNTNPSNAATVTVNPKPGSSHIYQYDPLSKK